MIILRIFQDLMRLDFPTEVLDRAIEMSRRAAEAGSGNMLESEIRDIVHSKDTLAAEFSQMPFFQVVFSLILRTQQTMWRTGQLERKSKHMLSSELLNVFKCLF